MLAGSRDHGITDEDVKDAPSFKEVAKIYAKFIEGCDLAGFNSSRFDIPLLTEEFLRVGLDLDLKKHKFVDVQVIYHRMERRTLSAAYKFYLAKELDNAHSAMWMTFFQGSRMSIWEIRFSGLVVICSENFQNRIVWQGLFILVLK